MLKQNSLTILHLSDLQFGKNHRFRNSSVSGGNFDLDTLQDRLQADLKLLKKNHSVEPDLIIITGDIVECGQKSEFDQALIFFNDLAAFLNVPKSNFIIMPGNHDINRLSCKAYFAECEGDEQEIKPPFSAKWRHFKKFYDQFYLEISKQFDTENPYSFFEYPDLKVAVAGINSTIKESHRDDDHYGWVGENQAQKIAQLFSSRKNEGWFNIAAVHHNVIRGEIGDNDNLRDAEMLQRVIGEHIDVLLHGHTHRGKINWWKPELPVIGAGSAAVTQNARPEEVPNQYQILKITGQGFRDTAELLHQTKPDGYLMLV